MSKLVAIDAGHGGVDPGAVANGLQEKDLVLDIANKTAAILKSEYGIDSLKTRTNDQFVELSQRTGMANKAGTDCLVSIHINAATPAAHGFESFVYLTDDSSTKSYALQQAVHPRLAKLFNRDRGMKKANFHMVREYKGASLLIELGFITNSKDAENLKNKEFIGLIAKNLAAGIADYLGVKKLQQPGDLVYRVIVDGVQKAAYADLENLANEVKKQASNGKRKIELELVE